ncbi:MAG: hypothetical protein CMG05_02545 [Candidatus Marinimicrobia bacterium]|nr:hypothetical protein [Candidatus Neomarinimicrobiota bacterium]|tara:strand:+ start:231 stop:1193 length:963 start_codon:yes stop_codon:yes gene_type:complete
MFGKKNKIENEENSLMLSDSLTLDMTVELPIDTALIDTNLESPADTNSQNLNEGIVDINSLFGDLDMDSSSESNLNKSMNDTDNIYQDVIQNMQDEITKLKSELDRNTEELYKLKAQSQIWNNPFSIYNKEIILTNGSTVYGKIKYQDQDVLHVETLIGDLTIQRNTIKRIIENITQAPDSTDAINSLRKNQILEIKKDEQNTIFKPTTKLLANTIMLGDITEDVDFRGNRTLRGDIKNIGEARADFVKINFVFRMNWQGSTKSLTAFVQGSKHVFPDSQIESDSSIEIGAVAGFELVIPPDFGQFIGYSYTIDWEQYDN